jgi:perosamine synthetase
MAGARGHALRNSERVSSRAAILASGEDASAARALRSAGCQPSVRVRFADIDERTLCLDPVAVERLITDRTRAIYAVNYAGLGAGLPQLRQLADRYGIYLIEDCAHATGTWTEGRSAGTWGDFGCWSFHGLKNISTLGQGGMVTGPDAETAERLRRMRCIEPDASYRPSLSRPANVFGTYPDPVDPRRVTHEKNAYTHDCDTIHASGLNARLGDPAAVVGRSQLRRLPQLIARRNELAAVLDSGLAGIDGLEILTPPPRHVHARHLYAFRLTHPGVDRNALVSRLTDQGIAVVLRYFPLHLLPEWRKHGHRLGEVPVTERVWFRELVNLPISPQLSITDMEYMAQAVHRAMRELQATTSLRRTA